MTSDEIKKAPTIDRLDSFEEAVAGWLQEIAYQLAVMNERKAMEPVLSAEREINLLLAKLPRVEGQS